MPAAGHAQSTSDVGIGSESSPGRPGSLPLARLASFRESAYRLLSQAFLYPGEESMVAAGTASEDDILDRFPFSAVWRRLQSALSGLKPSDVPRLQTRYVALFLAAPDSVPCPPYESAYRVQPGQDSGRVLAEIEAEYANAGLSRSPSLKESPDHVALEMEFMALLCGRESRAWRREDLSQVFNLLKRENRFLDRHLGAWLPEFSRALGAADPGGIYAAVGDAASVFVNHDRDLVPALLETSADAQAMAAEE